MRRVAGVEAQRGGRFPDSHDERRRSDLDTKKGRTVDNESPRELLTSVLERQKHVTGPDVAKWVGLFANLQSTPVDRVRTVLDENPAILMYTQSGAPYNFLTLLHVAARHGSLELVNELIARGADVNARTGDGCTPLHNAAMGGDRAEIIEALVRNGADINALMDAGFSALMWAYKYNHGRTVAALHRLGAKRSFVVTSEDGQRIQVDELMKVDGKVFLVALRDIVPPKEGELRMLMECTEVADLRHIGEAEANVIVHTDTIANAVALARRVDLSMTSFTPAESLNDALLAYVFVTALKRLNGVLPTQYRTMSPVLLWCRTSSVMETNQIMLFGLRVVRAEDVSDGIPKATRPLLQDSDQSGFAATGGLISRLRRVFR
jgi:hypothetical protein